MCGLFGTIRPHHYPQNLRSIAADALLDLGYLAEDRGVDSAGIATLHSRALAPLQCNDHAMRENTVGRCRIRTALGAFSTHLPDSHQVRNKPAAGTSPLILSTTRGPAVCCPRCPHPPQLGAVWAWTSSVVDGEVDEAGVGEGLDVGVGVGVAEPDDVAGFSDIAVDAG